MLQSLGKVPERSAMKFRRAITFWEIRSRVRSENEFFSRASEKNMMDDIGNLNSYEYWRSNGKVACFLPVSISERYDLDMLNRRASSVCERSWNNRINRSASCSKVAPSAKTVHVEIWAGPLPPKNPHKLN